MDNFVFSTRVCMIDRMHSCMRVHMASTPAFGHDSRRVYRLVIFLASWHKAESCVCPQTPHEAIVHPNVSPRHQEGSVCNGSYLRTPVDQRNDNTEARHETQPTPHAEVAETRKRTYRERMRTTLQYALCLPFCGGHTSQTLIEISPGQLYPQLIQNWPPCRGQAA